MMTKNDDNNMSSHIYDMCNCKMSTEALNNWSSMTYFLDNKVSDGEVITYSFHRHVHSNVTILLWLLNFSGPVLAALWLRNTDKELLKYFIVISESAKSSCMWLISWAAKHVSQTSEHLSTRSHNEYYQQTLTRKPSTSFVTITIRLACCNQTINQKSSSVLSIGPAAK